MQKMIIALISLMWIDGLTRLNIAMGASTSYFSSQKKVERLEKKHIKECKVLHPQSRQRLDLITQRSYLESIKFFECMIDFAILAKISNPKKESQMEINDILEDKIEIYQDNIIFIETKFNNGAYNLPVRREVGMESGMTSQRNVNTITSTESTVYIETAPANEITEEVIYFEKASTYEEALERCNDKGYNRTSIDSIEGYLFKKCIEEQGFSAPASARKKAPIISTPASARKKAEAVRLQKAKETRNAKELARKKAVQKKERVSPSPSNRSISSLSKASSGSNNKESPTDANEYVNVKTEVQKTGSGNIIYTKQTKCTIDSRGNKSCIYDPQYRIQGGTPVNKF